MRFPVSTHAALPADADRKPPEWLHVLPADGTRGKDGRGPYLVEDAAVVIAASMRGGKLVVDENHSTDLAAKSGGAAPARGWITGMQHRADGLWASVEWTGGGRKLLADHAYRGVSPVIEHTKEGRVLRVLRVALTNDPNLPLTSLHHQQESGMDLTKLREALGLPETATEAQILDAATQARTAVSTHAAQLARIAEAAGAARDAGPDAIVTSLQARGEADAGTLRTELVSMQSQLTAVLGERARELAERAVDAALAAGKPIPPALRNHYVARHMADPAAVTTELDAMISLNAGGLRGYTPPAAGGQPGMAGDEAAIVALLGVDPEAYRKLRDKRGVVGAAA